MFVAVAVAVAVTVLRWVYRTPCHTMRRRDDGYGVLMLPVRCLPRVHDGIA